MNLSSNAILIKLNQIGTVSETLDVIKFAQIIVFKTIIQRNIKLGEAPGFGKDIITYDVTSKGTKNYLSLADEIIKKNVNV